MGKQMRGGLGLEMHHEICACSLLDSGRISDSRSREQKLPRISLLLVKKKGGQVKRNGRCLPCEKPGLWAW